MSARFVDTVRAHIPSALWPLILEYADDCLDRFEELWDEDLKHDVTCGGRCTCEDRNPGVWRVKYSAWRTYRDRYLPSCRGPTHWLCAAGAYEALKHKIPILCRIEDNHRGRCVVDCKVCGRAQFKQP